MIHAVEALKSPGIWMGVVALIMGLAIGLRHPHGWLPIAVGVVAFLGVFLVRLGLALTHPTTSRTAARPGGEQS